MLNILKSLAVASVILVSTKIHAQITIDGSLSTAQSLTGPDFAILPEYGAIVDQVNLFHSFGQFNVGNSETATFSGPASIQNILSRVTGGSASDIKGTIRSTIAGANFFLLNPAGVLFGANATLDVSGAFVVSTADHLALSDGGIFYADLGAASTLTAGNPASYGFLAANPAGVSFENSNLEVKAGEQISIVSGDIQIVGGQLKAPGGDINLVSVGAPNTTGTVSVGGGPISFTVASFDQLGSIVVSDGAVIHLDGEGGGGMLIRAGSFTIDNALITSTTTGAINGKPIDIALSGAFIAREGARIITDAATGIAPIATDFINDLNVSIDITHTFDSDLDAVLVSPVGTRILLFSDVGDDGDDFTGTSFDDTAAASINDGDAPFTGDFRPSQPLANANGENPAGVWTLEVDDFFAGDDGNLNAWSLTINGVETASADVPKSIDDSMTTFSTIEIDAITSDAMIGGKGSSVTIAAKSVDVITGAAVSAVSTGRGMGGDITVNAESIRVSDGGSGNISAIEVETTTNDSIGMGGSITINTNTLDVLGTATVSSITRGDADAGDISITADRITVDKNGATGFTGISSQATGEAAMGTRGGALTISTDILEVFAGAQVDTTTFGLGNGGDLSIMANTITIDGQGSFDFTGLSSGTQMEGQSGDGGSIDIITQGLQISHEATITASTRGDGAGGRINLQVMTLDMDNRGTIRGTTSGSGRGGLITISGRSGGAVDRIRLATGAEILGSAFASGDGGLIAISEVKLMEILDDSRLAADTNGLGNSGQIDIQADVITIDSRGGDETNPGIYSTTGVIDADDGANRGQGGNGGAINLTTNHLQIIDGGRIEANTLSSGRGGSITIQATELNSDDGAIIADTFSSFESGTGGNITINSEIFSMNNSTFGTLTFGIANGGAVAIGMIDDTRGLTLTMTDRAIIDSDTKAQPGGNGGAIRIDATVVDLSENSHITATAFGGGNGGLLEVTADTIRLDGIDDTTGADFIFPAGFFTESRANPDAPGTPATGSGGSLVVEARKVDIVNGASISVAARSEGNGGDVTVTTETLTIESRGSLSAAATSEGNGGKITVEATDIVLDGKGIDADTGILSDTTAADIGGNGGVINITADNIRIVNGASIEADTDGSGDGGMIGINTITLVLDDMKSGVEGGIFTDTNADVNGGIGGAISIETGTLDIRNGSFITADTNGDGDGGQVDIKATVGIVIDDNGTGVNTGIFSDTTSEANGGNGGGVVIDTGFLEIRPGSQIAADTRGTGDGGRVEVKANSIRIDGGDTDGRTAIASATFFSPNGGDGGNVIINTTALEILRGGVVIGRSFGDGDGGTITVTTDSLAIDGKNLASETGIFSDTVAAKVGGDGGLISINAETLTIRDTGTISARSVNSGNGGSVAIMANTVIFNNGSVTTAAEVANGGNITITTRNRINLANGSITAQAALNGGEITLIAPYMIRLVDSRVTAESGNDGGNITIDPIYTILDKSQIIANAILGNGGDIQITTEVFLVSPDSLISASSEFGVAGNIEIFAPDVDISGSLVTLSGALLNANNQLQERCSVRSSQSVSSFIVVGRGALPVEPTTSLPAFYTTIESDSLE